MRKAKSLIINANKERNFCQCNSLYLENIFFLLLLLQVSLIILIYLLSDESQNDQAERHDLKSRFLLFILLFFFPLFLGGKRKENLKSRGKKTCLSARSAKSLS